MCWSLDSRVFYHIDTPRFVVRAFDYSVDEGVLTNARNVIQIDPSLGAPDGMTIDTEGMLWIAHWGGGRLSRWNPFLGKMLMEVLLPVSKITSCTFGGRLMDELFVTSAKIGLSKDQLAKEPLAGSTFHIKNLGFTGNPFYRVDDYAFLL